MIPKKTLSQFPCVTIIMPVRNEARFIRRSLGSILAQDYPTSQLEVLIVDGMSEDETREVITQIAQAATTSGHASSEIKILDNPQQIVPTAFNIGLKNAQGDVIIIVGGHCELEPDYVANSVTALQTTGADCVGGSMLTIGETWVAQTIALAQSSFFGVGGVAFRTGRAQAGYVDTVAYAAYRREVFERIGGFDDKLVRHQDYEFNTRLRQAGGKIYYTPAIKSRYYARGTFKKLAKQYFQYGFWKGHVTTQNSAAFSRRHIVAPVFALAVVSGTLLSPFSKLIRLAYLMLWAVYGTASLIASFLLAFQKGGKYFPFLLLTFAILHLCWGLGFWWGLVTIWVAPERLLGSGARR